MKLMLTIYVLSLSVITAGAQQLFHMEIDANQQMETLHGAPGLHIDLPTKGGTVMLGNEHDTEGLGQHLIYNGGRLLIENMVSGPGGQRLVTLRREDGRPFYDMFPLLKVTLIPLVDYIPESEESKQ
ncbi:MAG: hypothetical protein ABF295_03515 [Flavobacteriaceae bacterium]